jgi:hypothetical protein
MARKPQVGGKRTGAGRPLSADPRRNKVTVKLTDDQLRAVKSAASTDGRTVSDWAAAAFGLAIARRPTRE